MPEFFTLWGWMQQHGWAAWLLLLAYIVIGVIRDWLIKAGAAGTVRGLLNVKKRRFERMLTQAYLPPEAYKLAERELRQRSLYQLTGLFDHRLQEAAVLFCDRFGLRARYLAPWRSWLKEHDGQIVFNGKWHRRAWWAYAWICLPVTTLLMLGLSLWFASLYGAEMFAPFMLLNVIVWWFPTLMMTSVPFPVMTREMEARLAGFNQFRSEQNTILPG